jgi:transposase
VAISVDLRERVIAAINNGMRITEAAKIFKVGRCAIYDWQRLLKNNNNLTPRIGYQKGHSHKIKDWEKFKIFAEENREYSSPQMAAKWNTLTGSDVSDDVILKALKKIGYTSKKKLSGIQKQTKASVTFFWKKSKI